MSDEQANPTPEQPKQEQPPQDHPSPAVPPQAMAPKPAAPKTLLTTLLILVILGAAGYVLFSTGGMKDDGTPPTTMICMDEKCGAVTEKVLVVGETPPLLCPKCGQKTLVQAYFCPKCKKPLVLNEMRGGKPPTTCPACGEEVDHAM